MSIANLDIQIDHSLGGLKNFLESIPDSQQIFILTDNNTKLHCWPVIQSISTKCSNAIHIEIQSGEQHKNIQSLLYITERLANSNANKNAWLINLGGGVICDIGAFAASIYKRGIFYVHIPTSLLAQIDAAIGGKNGIDYNHYKNMLGTITFPEHVFISTQFLTTLPSNELTAGIAEAIKHALISDPQYFEEIKKNPIGNLAHLIERSIAIKTQIIIQDPFEKNIRKKLNAGHTIGHALETWMLQTATPVLHGEAVAAGIVMESYISMKLGYLPAEMFAEIESLIFSLFPKIQFNKDILPQLLQLMQHDKKNSSERISFSFIRKIGEASINDSCEQDLIEASISYYLSR